MNEVYEKIELIFQSQRKARANNDYITLIVNAEACVEYIHKLIPYITDQEWLYRKVEAKESETNTSSKAEVIAKASEYYKEYIKAKMMIELLYEMINISKKLATGVNKEFNTMN